MLATLDRAVRGTGRVQLVHANDSAQPWGSRRDKHAAIGAGLIGLEPFRELLHHPMLAAVPFVVETPKAGHSATWRYPRSCATAPPSSNCGTRPLTWRARVHPLMACARLTLMRKQFWFSFGYRPGLGTVARQTLL